jgi:hypothetical protein
VRAHNPLVLGSNPSGPTNRLLSLDFTIDWFSRCSRYRPSGENLRTKLPRPAPQREVTSPLSLVNRYCAAASDTSATRLHPSPVNDVALVRYRSTIICRKKKDEARNLFRSQTPLESLACHDLGLVFRRPPPAALALRQNRAG